MYHRRWKVRQVGPSDRVAQSRFIFRRSVTKEVPFEISAFVCSVLSNTLWWKLLPNAICFVWGLWGQRWHGSLFKIGPVIFWRLPSRLFLGGGGGYWFDLLEEGFFSSPSPDQLWAGRSTTLGTAWCVWWGWSEGSVKLTLHLCLVPKLTAWRFTSPPNFYLIPAFFLGPSVTLWIKFQLQRRTWAF